MAALDDENWNKIERKYDRMVWITVIIFAIGLVGTVAILVTM